MRKHKYSLTLLEVVIALSLTGILLTFLWQAYFSSQKQLALMQSKKAVSLQKVLFQEKLSYLTSSLVKEGASHLVYTAPCKVSSSPMLVFQSLLPIDLDPDFSGPTLSGLYLTDTNLCLVHWANEDKMRNEVLLKEVSSCEFLFFDAKQKAWNKEWSQKNQNAPEMIKIQITPKQSKRELSFLSDAASRTDPLPEEKKAMNILFFVSTLLLILSFVCAQTFHTVVSFESEKTVFVGHMKGLRKTRNMWQQKIFTDATKKSDKTKSSSASSPTVKEDKDYTFVSHRTLKNSSHYSKLNISQLITEEPHSKVLYQAALSLLKELYGDKPFIKRSGLANWETQLLNELIKEGKKNGSYF